MRPARRLGLALAGGLSALVAVSWGQLPLPAWSCPVRQLTGVPCPTCYLTRSVLACLRGDLAGSLHWHALGPPLLLACLWLLWQLLVRGRLPEPQRLRAWLVGSSLVVLAYWLLRLAVPALGP